MGKFYRSASYSLNFATGSIVLVLFLSLFVQSTSASGYVKLKFPYYFNPQQRLANGSCCSSGQNVSAVQCPGDCHEKVSICLTGYHQDPERLTTVDCPYGRMEVGGGELVPTEEYRLPFSWSWVGAFSAIVEIRHWDEASGQYSLILHAADSLDLNPGEGSKILAHDDRTNGITFRYEIAVHCDSNWYGPSCSHSCEARNDSRHYECHPETGIKICHQGWSGSGCDQPICAPNCRGTCDRPNVCNCSFGWTGDLCDQCVPYTGCKHGYCIEPFSCHCHERWGGVLCDRDQDSCFHKNPCKNGARCEPHEPDNYTCHCPEGFGGRNCEISVSACASQPCQNHGTCVDTGVGYVCNCGPQHTGKYCEQVMNTGDPSFCYFGENRRFYPHGTRWETGDCRQCNCVDGNVNCTDSACSPLDCLAMKTGQSACPRNQICRSVQNGTCLNPPCDFPYGECRPWRLVDHFTEFQCKNSSNCTQFFMSMDGSQLPKGTSVESICFHLLLVLLTKQLDQYQLQCDRIAFDPLVIRVDIMSLSQHWANDRLENLKNVLMDPLRHNLTVSSVLRAVNGVSDTIHMPAPTFGPEHKVASFDHVMLVSVVSGVIIFVFGMAILYLLWRRYRHDNKRCLADSSINSTSSPISMSSTSPTSGKGIYECPEIRNNLKWASSFDCLSDLEYGRRTYVRTCSPIPPLLIKKDNCGRNLLKTEPDPDADAEADAENWSKNSSSTLPLANKKNAQNLIQNGKKNSSPSDFFVSKSFEATV